MLTKTQKKYLKSLAATTDATVMIGKNGLNENILASVDEVLTAHEICKVSVLNTCDADLEELAIDISVQTHSEIVYTIGRKITFYRRNLKETKIRLPK